MIVRPSMLWRFCSQSRFPLTSEFTHRRQLWFFNLKRTHVVIHLRLNSASLISLHFYYTFFRFCSGMSRNQSSHGLSLTQSYWITLNILWLIFASMRMNIMRIKVCSIHKPTINRFCITSSVVFKRRLSEISCKSTIRDPSGRLFKLN